MTDDTSVQVDLVADFVCPWCWLGWRNWVQAREKTPEIAVAVVWRPYELDPGLPAEGAPYKDYMRARFPEGPPDQWRRMREHLEAAAPAAGIEFRFDDIPRRPSTLNAHRLMRWARGQGEAAAAATAEALFSAYFRESLDIGEVGVLIRIGAEAGLDAAILADLLASDRDRDAVREEGAFFRRLGVTGVPTYIFDGRTAIPGAVSPDTLAEVLREAAAAKTG